jgi:hypothetical protein
MPGWLAMAGWRRERYLLRRRTAAEGSGGGNRLACHEFIAEGLLRKSSIEANDVLTRSAASVREDSIQNRADPTSFGTAPD